MDTKDDLHVLARELHTMAVTQSSLISIAQTQAGQISQLITGMTELTNAMFAMHSRIEALEHAPRTHDTIN
jgi:hypothetical protein